MADDKKNDEDLFKEAFDSLSANDVFDGKFGDVDPDALPPTPKEDEAEIELVREVREIRTMEDAFFGVEKLDQSKRRRRTDEKLREEAGDPAPIEVESKGQTPEKKPAPPVVRSNWDRLADETKTGAIIDVRNARVSDAMRTLGIDMPRSGNARVVYEKSGPDQVGRKELEEWARGFGARFEFSPDSTDDEGLLAIGTL